MNPSSPVAATTAEKSIRRYPRVLFSAPVTLRHLIGGGVRKLRGITLDVSQGGLGALIDGDLRPGEVVDMDLRVGDTILSAVAIVRHTTNVRSGFEFLGMTPEERLHIAGVISAKPGRSAQA